MKKLLLLLVFGVCASAVFAANGDTTHIITHNQVHVITNPNSGYNEYPMWAMFPSTATNYRRALITLSVKCPASNGGCGAWDYSDHITIKHHGGVNDSVYNIELARFITPYGGTFNGTWSFSWHTDVTDFAPLLHDSVEIVYGHGGYEGTNVGWLITIDFSLIEGTPVRPWQSLTRLWTNGGTYGDANNPIENILAARSVTMDAGTKLGRVRIMHTGHGNDPNGCSEFCDRYRDLLIDGNQVDRFHLWITCDQNPLYPQGGTWIYTRGNWCPGAMVYPYIKQFAFASSSTHTIDVDMEPYTTASPSGYEDVVGYLFQYGDPVNANDASVEEIIRPSTLPEYSRLNPICNNPRIVIRNNGNAAMTSTSIQYGYLNGPVNTYNWIGNLAPDQADTVDLTNTSTIPLANNSIFRAWISSVNGGADQYVYDDTAATRAMLPPGLWETDLYLNFRTNDEASENSYELLDESGNVLYSRAAGTLTNSTIYADTFHLTPGCYRFLFHDTDPYGGDGLSFWANTAAGSGWIRLKRMNTAAVLKSFNGDFGGLIDYSFTAGLQTSVPIQNEDVSLAVYPNPSNGIFTVDFALGERQQVDLEIYNALGQRVLRETLNDVIESKRDIDLSSFGKGLYVVKLVGEHFGTTKKILVN